MKIALLGTGFGQAHAAVYAERPDVDEVVVFGRAPEKLAKIGGQFGFATSTDLDALITDGSVDLVDICLPTRLHADVAIRAMQAGKDVLIELPLAATLDDARRIVAAQQATARQAFVDMFTRFSPANQHLRQAVADQRHGDDASADRAGHPGRRSRLPGPLHPRLQTRQRTGRGRRRPAAVEADRPLRPGRPDLPG